MSKFYMQTGYKEKMIKNKLYITESLVKEKESILVQNPYAKSGFIEIRYFDKVYSFKSIKDIVDLIIKLEEIKEYCNEISEDEKAMSGEHLAVDDILEIIKKGSAND